LTTDADRSSFFIGLVIVDIFVGLADAISLPYIVLFLVDKAGLSPLSLGAILTARAACSIAFSAAFGAWIDKRTTLKPLVLALAGSSIGYGLLGFTTNFLALMIIAALKAMDEAALAVRMALSESGLKPALSTRKSTM
jgi:SET family sugar efflux transporter-like MFS transporter